MASYEGFLDFSISSVGFAIGSSLGSVIGFLGDFCGEEGLEGGGGGELGWSSHESGVCAWVDVCEGGEKEGNTHEKDDFEKGALDFA